MPATVWKGFISFGLVSFPIRLFTAARSEPVRFHMLHKRDKSRVKEVWHCAEEDKPIERSEIVKGYEYASGKYIIVDDDELKKVAPKTATSMEIQQFVRADEVDPLYLDQSYYVAPEKGAEKPYALLHKSMAETNFFAVAKIAMHNREHIVIIRPAKEGLVLHTMYFANEVHAANRTAPPKNTKYSTRELTLAKQLIDTLASPFKPEQYEDEYRKNVEQLIAQKRKGREVAAVTAPKPSKVVDIVDALERSLKSQAASKKAPASRKQGQRGHKAA